MFNPIATTLRQLNERQLEAVQTTEGPLLVVAGAGSGKTRMLTVRIAYLIEHCKVEPNSILAVTFTNKAAREMRERVQEMIPGADRVTLTTFHSFCCLLLRRWHKHAGFADGFTIYDETDSEKLMKNVLKEHKVDPKRFSPKAVLEFISQAKNELVKPEDYLQLAGPGPAAATTQKLYTSYQAQLQINQAVDFDDLIFKAYYLLKDNPELLNKLQNQYQYFLVDEYQDTNHAQYRLIWLISSASRNLCVVGDEDQSIYSWRGATIRNIQDFAKDFAGARIVKLEQNYRSTQVILDAAGEVIAKNVSAHPKKLWTDKSGGELINFYRASDDREEAEWAVRQIQSFRNKDIELGEMALLFRMNSLSRPFEQVLKKAAIPYDMTGGTKFFDRREVKDILAYLRFIDNPSDSIALERVINTPKRGIGQTTIDKIAASGPGTLWKNVSAEGKRNPDSKVGKFCTTIEELVEAAGSLSVSQLCRKVIDDIDYAAYLKNDDPETAEERLQNVKAIVSDIRYQEEDNRDLKLHDYLADTALHAAVDDLDQTQQKVHLMTLHNAKGLEFKVVFLIGMEEGIFPHHSSKEAIEQLEEERRLAYVGITRAREHLFLSAASRRMMFGSWGSNPVSRFVTEIPSHLFARRGSASPATRSASQATSIPGAVQSRPVSNPFNNKVSWSSERNTASSLNDSAGTSAGTMLNLKPGVMVTHKIFGFGRVEEALGSSLAEFRVTVRFEKHGTKTLLLQYAALQVINSEKA
ncbi:MAG: ATP-dependent DNA helicase PcrA [Candidatus Riflebacteria bacterium HGW-Riflebacteria-1]|nr:MAG: ATP-dependent DNA helicase PcrA [Candidatus Riflebacteria bacterium HGW-Riflebacteria-1]